MSQNEEVLECLKKHTLTSKHAFMVFGITRLSARIYDLRQDGHKISTRMIRVPGRNGIAHVAQYKLKK
jgi:hypothetical protein